MAKNLPTPLCTIGLFKRSGIFYLNIRNISHDDIMYLKQEYKKANIKNDADKTEYIAFAKLIYPPTIEEAKEQKMILSTAMQAAVEYLNNSGRYTQIDMTLLNIEACVTILGESPTQKQREEIENNADKLWGELVEKLHTPRVQELLLSLKAVRGISADEDDNESIYGHRFSFRNSVLALSQRPDAQFVATRVNWKRYYNREVLPNAKPIYLYAKLDNTQYTDNEVKDAEVSKFGADYKSSRMQQHLLQVELHFRNQGIPLIPYFDVKDTRIYNPNDVDYFNDEQGLSNNLTGKLNQWAQKEVDDSEKIDPEIEREFMKIFDMHKEDAKPTFNALVRAANKKFPSITVPHVNDNATYKDYTFAFYQLTKLIADNLVGSIMQIANPKNRNPKVEAVSSIVMLLSKLMPVNKIKKIDGDHLTLQDYLDVRNVVGRIINLINQNMMPKENKLVEITQIPNITSNSQFMDILSTLGVDIHNIKNEPTDQNNMENNVNDDTSNQEEKNNDAIQEIKENFFKTLNKINILWE